MAILPAISWLTDGLVAVIFTVNSSVIPESKVATISLIDRI